MPVNRIKHSRLIFKHSLIFTLIFLLHSAAQAQTLSAKKNSSNDTTIFTSIGFRMDTLHSVKRSIWGENAVFLVNDERNREWKVTVPPQFGLYGLQIKATPMLDILVDSTFGAAITGIQLEPSGTIFSDPITINLTIDDAFAKSPVIFFITDDSGNLTEIVNQSMKGKIIRSK
jgi:hypothetical protein